MKHCLTGAAWIFLTLALTVKPAAILMLILVLVPFWMWVAKLIKEQRDISIIQLITDFGKPENWQP